MAFNDWIGGNCRTCLLYTSILQNKDNTPNFTQSFTKIRKKNTIFLQEGELEDEYYTGIFIDIFPIDRMPSGKLKRYIFIWNCLKYQLLTREYPPVKGRVMEKLISKILLTIIPKEKRAKKRKALLKKIIPVSYTHLLLQLCVSRVVLKSNVLVKFLSLIHILFFMMIPKFVS